jgi:hypothetical protein
MSIKQVILSEFTIIYADNQKAIKLANNSIFQERTKHIIVKYHYTRDLIKHENVELSYKSIDQMIVDDLTKSLKSIFFEKFVTSLDMIIIIETSKFFSSEKFLSSKKFSSSKTSILDRELSLSQSIKNEKNEEHIIEHDNHS